MFGRPRSSNNRKLLSSGLIKSKASSPEPSNNDFSLPLIVSETTTTTTEVITTTTQTRTHVFTTPLWGDPGFTTEPAHHSSKGEHIKQRSMDDASALRSIYEKDLPPTPPNDVDPSRGELQNSTRRGSLADLESENRLPSLFTPSQSQLRKSSNSSSSYLPPSRSSTAFLAQAALGVSLPPLVPRVPSSSSETNTLAFTTPIPPANNGTLRRPKSAMKLRAVSSGEMTSTADGASANARRRSRGLSLGTTSFLNFGNSDAKGKGKETDVEPSTVKPPKTVSRRSSFWSRRKTPTTDIPAVPPVQQTSDSLFLPLPSVPPISPFHMDQMASPSVEPRSLHSRGLSRSFSERAKSKHPPHPPQQPDLPYPKSRIRRPQRPATADPAIRAEATRSLFLDENHILSDSPLPTPPPLPDDAPILSLEPSRRPRAQTNPPLLRRLSLGVFSSSVPLPVPAGSHSSDILNGSLAISASNSSRHSVHKPKSGIPKPLVQAESPEVYLDRLAAAVSKTEIAGILASSGDVFHIQALKVYISQFDFTKDPLDIALRRLLVDVGLPRETQQIDRVMEAFAGRYSECNPNLFSSKDHPYILAFSMIMLHTDAFNKSNKRKMTKADYIKNTRLPGLAPEVLDCFYDNIVFAPFIFIEDPLDVNGQRGLASDGPSQRAVSSGGNSTMSPTITGSGTNLLGKNSKVDPYYLILNNQLGPLRVNVETYVPMTSPYSFEGTAGPWDEEELQHAFAKANILEVGAARPASAFFSLNVGGPPSPLMNTMGAFPEIPLSTGEVWTLKITKVGILNRKDDTQEGGKKTSNRKWKPWSVILTGSQLLFFRDPSWAHALVEKSEASDGHLLLPPTAVFRPDELLSVKDAIAVYDSSYTKHRNALRFVMPDSRQLLLQADDEKELNEWISRINYASTFKSAGVRMRAMGMSGKDVELTGVAAATSHLHDLQHTSQPATNKVKHWGNESHRDLMEMLSPESTSPTKRPHIKRRVTLLKGHEDVDMEVPIAPEIDGADQFKATFDQVKADLAAGRWSSSDDGLSTDVSESSGPDSTLVPRTQDEVWRLPNRSHVIQSKIKDLESRITAAQSQLDSQMRFIRNVATLTPFQRSTRDRLLVAVQGTSRRIMQVRLDIAKLTCHRDVLSKDLAAEGRDWQQAKRIALKAATETLQSQRHEIGIPRMTISYHELDDTRTSSALTSGRPSSHTPESTGDSFHSALDFGPEWPSSDDIASSSFLSASHQYDSTPKRRNSDSSRRYSFPDTHVEIPQRIRSGTPSSPGHVSDGGSPRTSDEMRTHERFYTARETPEEAEEWNKTRCAQRVSLVRVPSGFLTRFDRRDAAASDIRGPPSRD